MPLTDPFPPFICMMALPLSLENFLYEASLSVQRVDSLSTRPPNTQFNASVEHLPSVATLLSAFPFRSTAHGTQSNSSDSPRLWFSPPLFRGALPTSSFSNAALSPL